MQVLAAVIKAGASREHEILAEIRDAVFSFIRKMEPRRVMDTMLVSRVRILYIRSLLARSPELQSIKVFKSLMFVYLSLLQSTFSLTSHHIRSLYLFDFRSLLLSVFLKRQILVAVEAPAGVTVQEDLRCVILMSKSKDLK